MEKILVFVIIMTMVLSLHLFSQVDFSGSADISIGANIPESDDYNSLINPGNVFGLKDIGISSSLIAKLDAGDEKTTFSAWFSLKEYPIGQGLLAATTDSFVDYDETTNDYMYTDQFVAVVGDTIFSFDLMRLSANVYITDWFSMEVGRQSMLTGYGYGWNPIDFANPLKNPTDPDAALRGVDGLSFKLYFGNVAAFKVYGVFPDDLLSSGLNFEEIKAGGEMAFNFPGLELKLAGFYDYDSTVGSDAYTPSVGAGFIADLFGIGVYGEAAVRKGSRNNFVDGTVNLTRKTDWLFSVLAGFEYTFATETYVVVEYFYNGEGCNDSERSAFKDTIQAFISSYGSPATDLINMYSPGYFAQHYILLNFMQPFYDINTDINLSAIFSPDSGALTLIPSINYSFSGNFSAKLAYAGMFDLYNNDFSEVSALPVRHVINMVFTYSF